MANYWIVIAIVSLVPLVMFYTAFRIIKFIAYDPDETFRIGLTGMFQIFLILTLVAAVGYWGTRKWVLEPEIKSLFAIYCSDSTDQNEAANAIDKDTANTSRDNILKEDIPSYLCSNEFKGKFVEFISLTKIYSSSHREEKGKVIFTTLVFLTFIYAVQLGFFLLFLISGPVSVSLLVLSCIKNKNRKKGDKQKAESKKETPNTGKLGGGQNER